MNILSQLSNQCVRCGICLPYCPTYQQTLHEAESPRGRIALMKALAEQQLSPESSALVHLDHCLQCQACESVCPLQVEYGKLLHLSKAKWQSPSFSLGLTLLSQSMTVLNVIARVLYLYQQLGLQRILRPLLYFDSLKTLDHYLLPMTLNNLASHYPAKQTPVKGKVNLFIGCLSQWFDLETILSCILLYQYFGFDVFIPKQQRCCGALHYHHKQSFQAEKLAKHNQNIFDSTIPTVSINTGCTAYLAQTEQLTIHNSYDHILSLLKPLVNASELSFSALNATVMVHEPCSLRYQLKQATVVYDLLKFIPDLEINALPNNQYCCGGAGSYMLQYVEMSKQLRNDKIATILKLKPDYVVTTNIGCYLHLSAGLPVALASVMVSPLTLLAQQLISPTTEKF